MSFYTSDYFEKIEEAMKSIDEKQHKIVIGLMEKMTKEYERCFEQMKEEHKKIVEMEREVSRTKIVRKGKKGKKGRW